MATCLSTRPSLHIAPSSMISRHQTKTPGVRRSRSSQILPSPISRSLTNEWHSVSDFFAELRRNFNDVATIEQIEIEGTENTWLVLSLSIQISRTTMHGCDACSHADAGSRSSSRSTPKMLTCRYAIFYIDPHAALLFLRTCRLPRVIFWAYASQNLTWQRRGYAMRHPDLDNRAHAR
jgi:hypothetical protein